MFLDWTKNLADPVKKGEFENSVKGSKTTLVRLMEIIDEYDNSLTRIELSPNAFDDANWAYKQAFQNGYRNALAKVKALINLDDQ